MSSTLQSILIANRGEIAARIIRTCNEMDRKTVAVYSDLDQNAPYVSLADEAYYLGPTEAKKSYLNIDRVIQVALEANVDAIHPGYGFLSENPVFSARCEEEGITFVGPSEESIRLAGNKIQARELVQKVNVSPVPGRVFEEQEEDQALETAVEIGFPILIKAAAGGGGKGMRVVEERDQFTKSFREARREAENAFGNPEVFLEKYFTSPRHIEIQVLADRHGNAVHFGERECSIQRRHQKLIEEAPSTIVDEELRKEMGDAATRIVKEANYTGAGTVEFLVDRERNYYFLEVNTRLQVEHPVTEMITGFDLVREQIEVEEGKEISYSWDDLEFRGWALECRVCAEDPESEFVPNTGTIKNIIRPEGPFIRFDGGVTKGTDITMHYDSMIGKLICWGQTRDQAIRRMKRALRETILVGIKTTIPLYLDILADSDFLEGNLSTHYLDDFSFDGPSDDQRRQAAKLAALLRFHREQQYNGKDREPSIQPAPASNWFQNGLQNSFHHD